jgi:hypothetical protein
VGGLIKDGEPKESIGPGLRLHRYKAFLVVFSRVNFSCNKNAGWEISIRREKKPGEIVVVADGEDTVKLGECWENVSYPATRLQSR